MPLGDPPTPAFKRAGIPITYHLSLITFHKDEHALVP
jgi:hypothetical protein